MSQIYSFTTDSQWTLTGPFKPKGSLQKHKRLPSIFGLFSEYT